MSVKFIIPGVSPIPGRKLIMNLFKILAVVFLLFNLSRGSNISDLNTLVIELDEKLFQKNPLLSDIIFSLDRILKSINLHLTEYKLDKQHKDSLAIIKKIKSSYLHSLDFFLNMNTFKRPDCGIFLSRVIPKIVSYIYDLRPILSEFLEKESVLEFVFKCQDFIFKIGSVQNFQILLYDPLNVNLLTKFLEQISAYFRLENLGGKENVLLFYFYYAEILSKLEPRDFPESLDHPKKAIFFISKYKVNVSENIITWLRLYCKNIDLIFRNPQKDLKKIEILFEMIKGLKDLKENDIDWAVGMFCAKNFKSFIFANPSLFTIYMNLISQFSISYRQKFRETMNSLDPFLSLELTSLLFKHELKKKKISASIHLKKYISDARLDPTLSFVDAHTKWQLALQDIKSLHFDLLKPEEISNLTETIRKDFINISSQYFTSNSTIILFTANAYIPILLKLNISHHPESENIAKNISRAVANYFYQKYSSFRDEINLIEIKKILFEFHGEVFKDNESFILLSNILTILKLNQFNFKALWNAFEDQEEQQRNIEMLILNFQQRFTKYIQSGTRNEDEIKYILEIFEYLAFEVKCFSKTQFLCFKSLICDSSIF